MNFTLPSNTSNGTYLCHKKYNTQTKTTNSSSVVEMNLKEIKPQEIKNAPVRVRGAPWLEQPYFHIKPQLLQEAILSNHLHLPHLQNHFHDRLYKWTDTLWLDDIGDRWLRRDKCHCPLRRLYGSGCRQIEFAGPVDVLWHEAQSALKAPTWKSGSAWQETQAESVPLNTPF